MNYKIDKPIRLIELFAGIGTQAMAMRNIGANFQHYKVIEFEKHAIASYNAIHGTDFPTMDITTIRGDDLQIRDTDMLCYVMTYSFPCQDLSRAGNMAGMAKGGGTRSGLLWEVERLLNECDELPQILLMENVPLVHSKKNMRDFEMWCQFLESKGYSNFYQDLNALDFGIPQNRNRCFMVSILGEYEYEFPTKRQLHLSLLNMYDYSYTHNELNLYDQSLNGLIRSTGNGEFEVREATKKGYAVATVGDAINFEQPNSKTRRGRVGKRVVNTLTTSPQQAVVMPDLRIHVLNAKEHWRLMGIRDDDFEKASKVNSPVQLSKQAGNAIVVNVLEAIFQKFL